MGKVPSKVIGWKELVEKHSNEAKSFEEFQTPEELPASPSEMVDLYDDLYNRSTFEVFENGWIRAEIGMNVSQEIKDRDAALPNVPEGAVPAYTMDYIYCPEGGMAGWHCVWSNEWDEVWDRLESFR